MTEDPIKKDKKSLLKPLLLPDRKARLTTVEAYLVPAGQTLRNIHASLEKTFTDYVRGKDQRINDLHRLAESFAKKFKGIYQFNCLPSKDGRALMGDVAYWMEQTYNFLYV